MRYKIKPFPAVRSNKKSWSDTVQDYHSKMNFLRLLMNTWEYSKEEIMEALIQWNYSLEFMIPMANKWSKKKKEEYNWQPHRVTPDVDNLFKAFTDTVFYGQKEYNDSWIYKLKGVKYWAKEGEIIFNITKTT